MHRETYITARMEQSFATAMHMEPISRKLEVAGHGGGDFATTLLIRKLEAKPYIYRCHLPCPRCDHLTDDVPIWILMATFLGVLGV